MARILTAQTHETLALAKLHAMLVVRMGLRVVRMEETVFAYSKDGMMPFG